MKQCNPRYTCTLVILKILSLYLITFLFISFNVNSCCLCEGKSNMLQGLPFLDNCFYSFQLNIFCLILYFQFYLTKYRRLDFSSFISSDADRVIPLCYYYISFIFRIITLASLIIVVNSLLIFYINIVNYKINLLFVLIQLINSF